MHSTNHKGNVAEAKIAAEAVALGIPVLWPMVEHGRYDLMFDLGTRVLRVQCKWASQRGDVIVVNLTGCRQTPRGYIYSTYTADEIDAVAVYCGDTGGVYLIPIELIERRRAIYLRLHPPKNSQRAALNWASEYELGAVAQWEERLRGTQEAAGSSPASSITETEPSRAATVGAHQFRNHFGYYMERAAAGDEINVTRHGHPYVRLVGVTPQLRQSAAR